MYKYYFKNKNIVKCLYIIYNCIKKYSEVKQKNMYKNKFQIIEVNKEQKVEWFGKDGL